MNISENKTTFSFYSQTQYGTQNFRTETVKDSSKVNQKNPVSSTRIIIYNIVFWRFSEILEQFQYKCIIISNVSYLKYFRRHTNHQPPRFGSDLLKQIDQTLMCNSWIENVM